MSTNFEKPEAPRVKKAESCYVHASLPVIFSFGSVNENHGSVWSDLSIDGLFGKNRGCTLSVATTLLGIYCVHLQTAVHGVL